MTGKGTGVHTLRLPSAALSAAAAAWGGGGYKQPSTLPSRLGIHPSVNTSIHLYALPLVSQHPAPPLTSVSRGYVEKVWSISEEQIRESKHRGGDPYHILKERRHRA